MRSILVIRYRRAKRDRNRGLEVICRITRFRMLTRLIATTVLSCSVLVARHAGAQQSSTVGDTVATATAGPTTSAARAAVAPARMERRERLPVVFYGVLGSAAVAAAVFHVDPDSGGYRDGWTTATDFPDKAVHALAAWAITGVGVDLGVRPRYAALAVCGAGTAFEFAQGYVSVYDVAADCVGAAGAATWQSWRAKRKARAARERPTP
jgi:hypothetical protein